jgi:hypothetical protein
MDDPQMHGTIEQHVAEEHELWERESAGSASPWFARCLVPLSEHRAAPSSRPDIPLRPLRRGELLRDLPNVAVGI